ncbi:hypothetical protein [Aeromonas allosaccharophila]|uniref:hypothetical protein n=1 Tax=Aeromonas allosaccharophila TaxID=656 RepID=UPI0012E048F3|nr:hypothetical protein [Aeromonas allosaccharophila]
MITSFHGIESGVLPPSKNRYPHFSPATVCQLTHIGMTPQPNIRPFGIPLFGNTRLPLTLVDYRSNAHCADCQLYSGCRLTFLIRANNQEHKQGVSLSFRPQRITQTEFGAVISNLFPSHFMDNSSRNRGQKEIPRKELKIIDE